jgi:Protein of unknown function (DUF2913)
MESESQGNLFITRWFAQAKKQRRFSRHVAIDVDWILNQGRMLVIRARLRHKLDYLWRICTGELSEQNIAPFQGERHRFAVQIVCMPGVPCIRRQLPRPHRDNYSGLFVI